MKSIILIAGAAGMTAAAAPLAGDFAAKAEQVFAAADMNADRALTEQEYVDYAASKARADFAAMAGVDASLTREELADAWTKAAAEKQAGKPLEKTTPVKTPKN